MLAFEVTINGETTVVAGTEGISVLSLILSYRKASGDMDDGMDEINLSVGGLLHDETTCEHLDWLKRCMVISDTISIRVIETNKATPSFRRRQENPEWFEESEC